MSEGHDRSDGQADDGDGGPDRPDREAAGDPGDPRFDAPAVRRSRRARVPRWAVLLTLALVVAMTVNLVRHGAGVLAVLEALGFAILVSVPVVALLLFADRRIR